MERRLLIDPEGAFGDYVPVLIEALPSGIARDLELFCRAGDDFFLVKPKDMEVDKHLIGRFIGQQTHLFIRNKDREKYFKNLNQGLGMLVRDPALPLRTKAAVLTDTAVGIIDDLFNDPNNPNTIKDAKGLTQGFMTLIGTSQHAFLHLVDLSSHDAYTYAHSVGVAAYSIALAQKMNLPQEKIVDMGLAGLLHDIGKCMVDPAIINKKGPLSPDEWAIMKKHPEYGGEILKRHRNLDPLVAMAAESHHENMDGTGYPRGLKAKELDFAVKLISLADAFSALTTRRTYSEAKDTLTAFKMLKENIDKKFDSEIFRNFLVLFLDPAKNDQAA